MPTYGTFPTDEPHQTPEPETEPEPEQHPVQRAKAPWKLKAESYLLFMKLKDLPKGVYDPLEAGWADEGLGEFVGGLGSVMIVRYSDTPVGPYDELVFIPGTFTIPQPKPSIAKPPMSIPKKAQRISRIYVSQRTTAYNGRLNWNIPKHLARFTFSSPPTLSGNPPPSSLTVKVFPPGTKDGDGVRPFFACTLKPWTWVPSFPLNTKYLPLSMAAAQPPIAEPPDHREALGRVLKGEQEEVDAYDVDPKKAESVYAGTDQWCFFDVGAQTARARGCWVEVHDREGKDGDVEGKVWFPEKVGVWSVGAWLEEADWSLGEVVRWKL